MRKKTIGIALDIGEVAKRSGLPPSTLRFYEEKGLIRSTGRSGLRRLFDPRTLEQLEFVALARSSGFTLHDVLAMLGPDGGFRIDRKSLLIKATELGNNIKQLIAVQDLLEHVAHCPKKSQFECPKFQRLLKLAGRIQQRDRHRKRPKKSG